MNKQLIELKARKYIKAGKLCFKPVALVVHYNGQVLAVNKLPVWNNRDKGWRWRDEDITGSVYSTLFSIEENLSVEEVKNSLILL